MIEARERASYSTTFPNLSGAHHLHLQKLLSIMLSRSMIETPADILSHSWIQVAVSFLKPPDETAVACTP
jgi:hypothetical protein